MRKSKLFIASIIVIVFGALGTIAGISQFSLDMILFYISVVIAGVAMKQLDFERQLKLQAEQSNAIVVNETKGLKRWQILFILAVVIFAIALIIHPNSPEDDTQTISSNEKVTEKLTEIQTEPLTELTTKKPTEPPTEKPTEPPTEKPTEPPTEEPTEPPTEKPTEPPTEEPTEPPTERVTTVVYDIPEQQTNTYVLNTETMKVHRGSCGWVSQISPENYATTTDLQWAFNNGYTACKKCNP